jgi:hypothetical protein
MEEEKKSDMGIKKGRKRKKIKNKRKKWIVGPTSNLNHLVQSL